MAQHVLAARAVTRDKHSRLGILRTPALDAVAVPDSVVRDWRRRQQALKEQQAVKEQGFDHQWESQTQTVPVKGGGELQAAAPDSEQAKLARMCRQIGKLVPYDERGAWLLRNFLEQVDPGERKRLSHAIRRQLMKREESLTRIKDSTKLEYDRRCVFTKGANEIRTSASMMAETNRFDALSSIVKDLQRVRLRQTQKIPERTVPSTEAETACRPYGRDGGAGRSSIKKSHASALSQTSSPSNGGSAFTPSAGVAVAGCAPADNGGASCRGTMGERPVENGGKRSGLARTIVPHAGRHDAAPKAGSRGVAVTGHILGGSKRLALPPLDIRYGSSVVDAWTPTPAALRLGRPRKQSVCVASLDRRGFAGHVGRLFQDAVGLQRSGRVAVAEPSSGELDNAGGGAPGSPAVVDVGVQSALATELAGTQDPRCVGTPEETEASVDVLLAGANTSRGSGIALPNLFARSRSDLGMPAASGVAPWQASPGGGSGHSAGTSSAALRTLDAAALGFRSNGARRVFKQTQRLLESLKTPARGSLVSSGGTRFGGGGAKAGGHAALVVHRQACIGPKTAGADSNGTGGRGVAAGGGLLTLGLRDSACELWRGATKPADKLARLQEVFRCVRPPHDVRIESEILVHDASAARGAGAGGADAGAGGSSSSSDTCSAATEGIVGGGLWDDFVSAWEVLGDGILAGRVLAGCWAYAKASMVRATDDLLSDGLMRALLSARCYRAPGLDQVFVEWLAELLEVVRAHVRVGCTRLPSQYGLTAGLEWFREVINDLAFGRSTARQVKPQPTR